MLHGRHRAGRPAPARSPRRQRPRPTTATTGKNGIATAFVASTKSGTQTVTATADSASSGGAATYALPTVDKARNIVISPVSATITATGKPAESSPGRSPISTRQPRRRRERSPTRRSVLACRVAYRVLQARASHRCRWNRQHRDQHIERRQRRRLCGRHAAAAGTSNTAQPVQRHPGPPSAGDRDDRGQHCFTAAAGVLRSSGASPPTSLSRFTLPRASSVSPPRER